MKNSALEGVKVADFTTVLAGPVATKTLADYGATVVKVESLHRPDQLRASIPLKDGRSGTNRSGYFAYFNSNKYSMSLNLNHPKGLETARKLIMWADVVAENFRPGIMERWGFGYDDLSKARPDLVMVRSSNQGQTGPCSKQPGLGTHVNAMIGLASATGWPDGEPMNMISAYCDYVTPFFNITAVVAALDYRRRTGKGQLLDLSQVECGLQFFLPLVLDYSVNGRDVSRVGNSHPCAAPHAAFPCQGDDNWCAIAVFTDAEWEALVEVIGKPPWALEERFATVTGRKQNEADLNRFLGEWTVNLTAGQITEKLQARGLAAGIVKSAREMFEDEQLRQRGFYWLMDHPEIGPFHHMGQASILSKTPATPRMPAPCLGEHTEMVCRTILGMSAEEYCGLQAEKVFE